jgi:hypothetical protein
MPTTSPDGGANRRRPLVLGSMKSAQVHALKIVEVIRETGGTNRAIYQGDLEEMHGSLCADLGWHSRKWDSIGRELVKVPGVVRDEVRIDGSRQVAGELGAVQRGGEEEAQRRGRAVEGRRLHATLGQVHLVAAHIVGRGRVGRAAEEAGESLDVADIVASRLLAELAYRHVLEHALAQRADGPLAHRGLLS